VENMGVQDALIVLSPHKVYSVGGVVKNKGFVCNVNTMHFYFHMAI
jgi:hypothetical protein